MNSPESGMTWRLAHFEQQPLTGMTTQQSVRWRTESRLLLYYAGLLKISGTFFLA